VTARAEQPAAARVSRSRVTLVLLAVVGIAGFTALGVWQLHRRVWKLALIAQVDARVHAPPAPPPGPAAWPQVTAKVDQYLRVRMRGRFDNDRETLVEAVTDLGSGFWVLTPFVTDRGFTVLVNRGFVPPDRRDPAARRSGLVAGETTITGLLRMSAPGGGFLRRNDPAHDRWYSADVAAIAAARGVSDAAPYMIDEASSGDPRSWPRGGLTLISFPNNHLIYAITWFGLAIGLLVGVIAAWRDEARRWRVP
jgi:surfeit locus 1 family protein